MRAPIETLAGGLGHPEGPDILPDGRIVMVETYTSKIIAWSRERGIHDYADCGGGPNACMLGSDGAVYITQNGGTVGAWKAEVMNGPSIQKAWPDGRVENVVDGGGRHPAPGPQRPHVRAGRPALLHRPRRLPAQRPQARPRLRAEPRRHRRVPRGAARRVPQRHRGGARRQHRVGRVVRPRRLSQAARPPSRADRPAARGPHPRRAQDRRRRRPVGHHVHGRRRRHPARPDGTVNDFLETGGVPSTACSTRAT